MFMTYQTTIYFGEEQEINAPSMHFQNGAYCQKQNKCSWPINILWESGPPLCWSKWYGKRFDDKLNIFMLESDN